MTKKELLNLSLEHKRPFLVIDHQIVKNNYRKFKKLFPRVQAYYAVKANSEPQIVETLYKEGTGFDVASLQEFLKVYQCIKTLPAKSRNDFILNKIIYAHPIKLVETIKELDKYKTLVTYDNEFEIEKLKSHSPNSRLILRLKVPNVGAVVELSSKFGADPEQAVFLIEKALKAGLSVEGMSFHVGSQCTNFENYLKALEICADIRQQMFKKGYDKLNMIDIGGGFPAPYDDCAKQVEELSPLLNAKLDELFPKDVTIIAEPGRYMVANSATLVVDIIGKAIRNKQMCYYVNDGVYHTYSGIIFDHCTYDVKSFKTGQLEKCTVFGPTCDALDTITTKAMLPTNLKIGDLLYSENIGAYSNASSTSFNGFPPAKIVHVNQ